ncbi:MAG: T9SS type A sorting domain-containing protein [Sporocytophaga sp.]|uniref:T9SS type A sorting domain-containing protein n=1 Tax=Sporocytophaga sp. TaxID=2231183 RepID=UPI001B12145A|nr:T9SS type A sorting domain-containing protein [Sporocytophaga sp.]MBO9701144.1 T9SS type A sorting domain-containing protein [Sporocytophaga sp.]
MKTQALLVFFFLFTVNHLKAQNFIWSNRIQVYQGTKSIACDDSGNVYVAGTSYGAVSLDSVKLSVPLFFAKYNSEGNLVWEKTIKGNVNMMKICMDSKGNIYIAGNFNGSVLFGQYQLSRDNYQYSNFLVKCDYNGNFLWAKKTFSGSYFETPMISTDNIGNVYLITSNGVKFESDLPVSEDGKIVISKLNDSGEFQWIKTTGVTEGGVQVNDFSVDSIGNIYITGSFGSYYFPLNGSISFGTNSLVPYGEISIFLTKFDVHGNSVWAKRAGGERAPYVNYYDDKGQFLHLDNLGNVYMSGTFGDSAVFEGVKVKRKKDDYRGMFYCKYDTSGNFKWVKSDAKGDITTDYKGNIYVVSEKDLLIKCNPDGEKIWSITAPIEAIDQLDGPQNLLATDSKGNCYMIGLFMRKITLGHTTFVSQDDGTAIYVSCINDGTFMPKRVNTIKGKVFTDKNGNCSFDSGEDILSNVAVTASPGGYYTITDQNGNYEFKVDSGTYHVSLVKVKSDVAQWKENCFQNSYEVKFTGENQDVSGLDLELKIENCPLLEIRLKDSFSEFTGEHFNSCDYPDSTYIFYCNYGDVPVSNVQLKLEYPQGILPIASSLPWDNISNNVITFDISTLGAKECGYIGIKDLIEPCDDLRVFTYSGSITPFSSCKNKDTIFYKSSLSKSKLVPVSVIGSISSDNLKILTYPNPFNEEMTFSINGLDKVENVVLSLIDSQGKTKYKEDVEVISMDVNITLKDLNLDQGIYFYKIESKNRMIGKGKLIKM